MFCPKCEEKLLNPMAVVCPKCNYDLGNVDQSFVEKFDEWLQEQVKASEINSYKAAFLLHLSSKLMRSVQVLDIWTKAPYQMESKEQEGFGVDIHFARIKNTDIHVSSMQTWDFFAGREYMNDPYIRVIERNDIPKRDLAALHKQLADMFLAKSNSNFDAPDMELPDYSRGQNEYLDFSWTTEDMDEFEPINHLTGGDAARKFWEIHQTLLLEKLQPYLNQGWIPTKDLDATCIQMNTRDSDFYNGKYKPLVKRRPGNYYFFKSFQVKLERPKKQ